MNKIHKLDFSGRKHMVERIGLGAESKVINRLKGRTREQAINIMLRPRSPHAHPPPVMTAWNVRQNMYGSKNPALKMRMHKRTVVEGDHLKQWWVGQMLATEFPLLEKMTLFWHSHFTSSLDKTEQPRLNYKQNMLFRRMALGNFGSMLKAVAKDPAMSIYLDGNLNKKNNPNENFARELLELFTLGHGHYSQQDVEQTAKAFTGWEANRYKETYVLNKRENDRSEKTLLGKTVRTGDDVINVLLAEERTAITIAEKFWHYFVSDSVPDKEITNAWAASFRDANYEIMVLLREVLNSDVFWAKKYRGTLTKSPADLIVGTLRTLPFKRPNNAELARMFRLLGQDLFDPPNVKGWIGGQSWLNSQTVMARTALLSKLSAGNPNAKVALYQTMSDKQLQQWLLPHKPITAMPMTPGKVRLVRALVLDPYYQFI